MNKLVWCAAVLLTLSACSKNFVLFNNNPDRFNLNNLEFETLSLKTKIKANHHGESLKATANIRMKKDSIIWFSLTPGLGLEAARGIITKDSIVVLDKLHKKYEILKFEDLNEEMHFEFSYHLIESIIIGNLIWAIEQNDEVERETGFYSISKAKGDISITNYIGANSKKLEKLEAQQLNTDNTLRINYDQFQEFSDKIIPTDAKIQIKHRQKKDNIQKLSNINLQHTKIEIDKKNLKFAFSIPSKYERK